MAQKYGKVWGDTRGQTPVEWTYLLLERIFCQNWMWVVKVEVRGREAPLLNILTSRRIYVIDNSTTTTEPQHTAGTTMWMTTTTATTNTSVSDITNKWVVNLSITPLTEAQTSLLARGPKSANVPRHTPKRRLCMSSRRGMSLTPTQDGSRV